MLQAAGLGKGSLLVRSVVAVLALLVVLLVALAVTVETVLGAQLRAQIEDRLRDRAAAASALIGTVSAADLANRLSAQGLSVVIRNKNGDVTKAGPTPGQLRAGPKVKGLPAPPGAGAGSTTGGSNATVTPKAPTAGAAVAITSSRISADNRIITLTSALSNKSTIVLTADVSSVEQTLAQLRWVMFGSSAAFLGVAAAGLVVLVRMSLRPLDRMTTLARSISSGDRGQRLRPDNIDTEIGRVAAAFDEMLDAIEGAERSALDGEARVRSFVSDAAHELRTPVAGIQAAAETLVRSPGGEGDRERLASHVAKEAGRASRLINDMLMMARVDRGLQVEMRPLDLGSLVKSEVERSQLRRPQLRLMTEGVDAASVVRGDADRLAQVISNLVDNAAHATRGTGRVTVAIAPAEEGMVALTVSDDGPGVAINDRERIFDRLVRLNPARDHLTGGSGLGLTIARGIARAHLGELRCIGGSTGAVFELRLPVAV